MHARGSHKRKAPEHIELAPLRGGIDITVDGKSALAWLAEVIDTFAISYVREDCVEVIMRRARRAVRDDCVSTARSAIRYDGGRLYIANVLVSDVGGPVMPGAVLQAKAAFQAHFEKRGP
jgi:hypothetical protein